MTEPCKRHRADKSVDPDWMPVDTEDGKRWAIAVVYRCMRCGDGLQPRIAMHTIRPTQREAMVAYGLAQATVDGFFPPEPAPKPHKVVRVKVPPLSCWPFRVSSRPELMATHAEREAAERASRAKAMEGVM